MLLSKSIGEWKLCEFDPTRDPQIMTVIQKVQMLQFRSSCITRYLSGILWSLAKVMTEILMLSTTPGAHENTNL